jgi:hypothetical protein
MVVCGEYVSERFQRATVRGGVGPFFPFRLRTRKKPLTRSQLDAEPMKLKSPPPQVRDLAQQLLACEAAVCHSSGENTLAVLRVTEKLRRTLTALTGATGFRALLSRALTLAQAHVPSLSAVQIKPDGSLEGFSELLSEEAAEGGVLLIIQLIGLLVAFLGEDLTLRLVLDVWPDLPVSVTKPPRESEHDPTN